MQNENREATRETRACLRTTNRTRDPKYHVSDEGVHDDSKAHAIEVGSRCGVQCHWHDNHEDEEAEARADGRGDRPQPVRNGSLVWSELECHSDCECLTLFIQLATMSYLLVCLGKL